ncbi:RNA-directed DNA polymerase, eukaryota, reverse transcriptase zinc-binding domain protein, partial [Tanacetum coccineum]
NGPWFIRNNPLILKKWHPDENLLKEDVSTVLVWVKLHGVPVTAFSDDGLSAIATKWSSYARVMIELRADVDLKDNIVVVMPRIKEEGHYICNVRVEYDWKPHRNLFSKSILLVLAVIRRKVAVPTIDVSNSNPFEVLNSVNNDVEKFEELLTSGKATLVDEAGNPLKKVEFPDDYDSEDEVASVDNDMARSMASEMVGFGTQSLLEQWRDSYGNGDYDDDPYDDDMYERQDLSQELQAICDNLDIRFRGRKKKKNYAYFV